MMEFAIYQVTVLGILILLTQSLSFIWRANLFSLGHHGFMAIGAYSAAATLRLVVGPMSSWQLESGADRLRGLTVFLATLVIATGTAALAGFLAAKGFRLLNGDYFAVATLILAEIIRETFSNCHFVGGGVGYEAPELIFHNSGDERILFATFYFLLVLAVNCLVFLGIWRVSRSPFGLYIAATREDSLAAELSGIDTARLQQKVLTAGTAIAGLTGSLFFHFFGHILPDDFSFINGLPVIIYVVLGRQQTLRCIYSAVIVYGIFELIKLRFFGVLGDSFGQALADWKEVLLSLTLLAAAMTPALLAYLRRFFTPDRAP